MEKELCLSMDITYPINTPDKFKIKSNIKKSQWSDMLADVVHAQVGKGKDDRKAKDKDVYHIRVGIDLSDDSIVLDSDTGNHGLTTGILMDILGRMEK